MHRWYTSILLTYIYSYTINTVFNITTLSISLLHLVKIYNNVLYWPVTLNWSLELIYKNIFPLKGEDFCGYNYQHAWALSKQTAKWTNWAAKLELSPVISWHLKCGKKWEEKMTCEKESLSKKGWLSQLKQWRLLLGIF